MLLALCCLLLAALFLAASCGLPAELQQLVLQGDKGLQQDIVKHHVWKTLQATVWNQDLCTSSWLAQMLNAQVSVPHTISETCSELLTP